MQKPIHFDLAEQLQQRIEQGEWKHGDRLPSVRTLAAEMDVSPFTISRALRELAATGHVQTVRGKGVFAQHQSQTITPVSGDLSWQNAILRRPVSNRASQIMVPLIKSLNLSSDLIVLASGGETTDVLPTQSFEAAWRGLLNNVQTEMLAGWAAEGELPTRTWISEYLTGTGIETTPDNVIVTSGGQQGLSLVAQTLLQPDDTVLVERPMYLLALSIFDALGVRCIDVAVNESGTWVDSAEDLIERFRPKLVLTAPTGQVPTGYVMSYTRRRQLLNAARKYGIIIVEDDHASELTYDGPAPAAIKSLDTHGHVVYVKSFSKITMPALRLGALVAEGPIQEALRQAKLISDRYTSTVVQQAFLAYVTRPSFSRDLNRYRTIYRERRDAMLAALEEFMPQGATWTRPAAGFHLWLTMPEGVSAQEVALRGAANGVLVARGSAFHAQPDADRGVRLTFTSNEPERLREGIRRLAEAVQSASNATPLPKHAQRVLV